MGEAEEQITPEDLMKWLEANDKDINERVMYLHNLFDAIEEIERLDFKLEQNNVNNGTSLKNK